MRLLEIWVATPLAGAVGWTLLHSLWEGAIISAALGAVLSATRSPRARYAAACVAMAAVLAGFGLTLFHLMPEGGYGLQTLHASSLPAWNVRSGLGALDVSNSRFAGMAPWLAPFWIAGVWIFSLRQLVAWIAASRLRRRGVCIAPERWQKDLARLRARLRVSRPVLLLESCIADVPMVLGHFRPIILMPIGQLAGFPAAQIEAILAHELAHIRRCDYLVNLLQRVVEGLLFYHPAVWWVGRVIRAERENCCDDVAVATSGSAHDYAVALAALEQNRWPGRDTAVAATGGVLMKRIRRLLYPRRSSGAWTPLFAALALIVIVAVTLAAWQAAPPSRGSAATQPNTDGAMVSPYVKWLNAEAVYIIDSQESAAFQRLTTDAERKMFIEQFWQRRDPLFKEEHYRRIAYANQQFSVPGTVGWRTDRGHMYIVYGPPDEIESHPKGAPHPYAAEMWLYRRVEGLDHKGFFTFIDRTGQGDYRLAPGTDR